jgi:hypothetical protein
MVSPKQQQLAVWLLRRDVNDSDEPDVVLGAAERSLQMLCIRLAKLVTASGCELLLARAIHLAAVENPFLRSVRAGLVPGMCLEGLRESGPGATFEQMEAGVVAVSAQFIGLLDTFIGEGVTGRLIRDIWPDAPLNLFEADSAAQKARS